MANTVVKITDLTAMSSASAADVFVIVDVANDETKKIDFSNLRIAIGGSDLSGVVGGLTGTNAAVVALQANVGVLQNTKDSIANVYSTYAVLYANTVALANSIALKANLTSNNYQIAIQPNGNVSFPTGNIAGAGSNYISLTGENVYLHDTTGNSYVRVTKDYVTLESNTNIWKFDGQNGVLYFPTNNLIIDTGNTGYNYIDHYNSSYLRTLGPNSNASIGWYLNGDTSNKISEIRFNASANGAIELVTGDTGQTIWNFSKLGEIRFPNNDIQANAFTGAYIANTLTGLTGANTAITNLQTGLTGANTNITALQGGISGVNASILNVQSGISGSNASILNLQTGISGSNNSINSLQSNLSAYAVYANSVLSNAGSGSADSVQANLIAYSYNISVNINSVQSNLVSYASTTNTRISGSESNVISLQGGISGSNVSIINLQSGIAGTNTAVAAITNSPVTFQSDVTIRGNITLTGNTTIVTANTISFGDSLLALASNNYISDNLDIGLYGHYWNGTANSHTGIFRSAASKDWMIFSNYTIDLAGNSEITISNSSFQLGNLRIKTANASQDVLAANAVLSTGIYSNGVELRANDYATYLTAAGGLSGANASIVNLQSGLTGSNTRISGAESNVVSLQGGISGSNTRITGAQSNVIALQGGIAGANSSINTVQDNLTSFASFANSSFITIAGNTTVVQQSLEAYSYNVSANINSVQSNLVSYASTTNNRISGAESNVISLQSGISGSNTRISGAEANVISLQSGIAGSNTAITNLQGGLSGANSSIVSIQSGISGSNTAIINLQSGLSGSNAAITNLQTGLSGSNTRISEAEANVLSIRGGLTGANSSINTVQSNLAIYAAYANSSFSGGGGSGAADSVQSNLTSYASTANARIANTEANVISLQGGIAGANTAISSNYSSILGLQSGLSGSNAAITNLQTGLTGSNTDITNLQTGLIGSNTRISGAESNVIILQGAISGSNTRIAGNYSNVIALQSGLTGSNTNITNLQSGLSGSNTAIVNLQTGISGSNTRITGAESNVIALQGGIAGSNTRITGNYSNVIALQAGISGSNTRITGSESNVIALQGGISGANSSINTVQGNLAAYAVYANSTFTASGGNVNAVQSNLTVYAAYANTTFSGGGGGGTFTGGTVSGATTFSNGVTLSSTLTAGGSVGASGQTLLSTGTGVQWGALSPGYNYSSQFNGSSTYLSFADNTAFNFGTGDATVEFWFNSPGTNNNYPGIVSAVDYNLAGVASIRFDNTGAKGKVYMYLNGGGDPVITSTSTISYNTWAHIAIVRQGTSLKLYLNGSLNTTVTISGSLGWYLSNGGMRVGRGFDVDGSNGYFPGYISNLRLVKGVAVYTGAFTPPTGPLTAVQTSGTNISAITGSQTSLLTCQSISVVDNSANLIGITNNNGVTTTATQSPFSSTTVSIPTASLTSVRQQFTGDGSTTSFSVAGGYTANAISVFVNGVLLRNGTEVTVTNGSTVVFAIAPLSGALIDVVGTVPTTYSSITPVSYSVGFNGTNQYLTTPITASGPLDISSNTTYTIEGWVNWSALTANRSVWNFSNKTGSPTSIYYQLFISSSTGKLTWEEANTSAVLTSIGTTFAPTIGTWYHIAIVRNGTGTNNITIYVNGVSVGAGTYSPSDQLFTEFMLGAIWYNGAYGNFFPGNISNVRVVKGVGVYTGAFTPPQTPLAAVQSATNPSIQAITGTQTSLLTCNGPTIIDGSTNAFTITNNGSAPVSTAIVPTFTNVTVSATAGSYSRVSYTATAGQTTFAANYNVNYVQVYLNGILLNGADYTATNGTTVVLGVAAALNDIVEIVANSIAVTTGVLSTGTPVSGQLASWTSATNTIQGFAPSAAGDIPFSTDGTTFTSTSKIVRGTSVASTSGTSIDFTSIPSWVKRISVLFNGVSTSGVSTWLVRIGSSSGVETTGYLSSGFIIATTGSIIGNGGNSTVGYLIFVDNASYTFSGKLVIDNISSNTWVSSYVIGSGAQLTGLTGYGAGTKTISGVLDRIRLTTVNGTDTFDAGSVNILYE